MASGKYVGYKATNEILKAILDGYNKGVDHLLEKFLEKRKYSLQRTVDTLVSKGLIEFNGEILELTPAGLEIIDQEKIDEIFLKPQEWDGIWRIVAYDIPEDFRLERDYFRRRLKELGFTKIQGSMWLIPWDSKEEVAILAEFFKLTPFVMYLTTDYVPNQSRLKLKYGLR